MTNFVPNPSLPFGNDNNKKRVSPQQTDRIVAAKIGDSRARMHQPTAESTATEVTVVQGQTDKPVTAVYKQKRRRRNKNFNNKTNNKDVTTIQYETGVNTFSVPTDLNVTHSETLLDKKAFYAFTFTWTIFSDKLGPAFKTLKDFWMQRLCDKINSANRNATNIKQINATQLNAYFRDVLTIYSYFVQNITFGSRSEMPLCGSKTQNYATEVVNQRFLIKDPVPNIRYVKQSFEDLFLPVQLQKLVKWFVQPFTTNPMGYGLVISFIYSTAFTNVIQITGDETIGDVKKSEDKIFSPINFNRTAFSNYLFQKSESLKKDDDGVHLALVASGLMNDKTLDVDFKPNKKPEFDAVKWTISTYFPYYTTTWTDSQSKADRRDIDNGSIVDMHINAAKNLWWIVMVIFNINGSRYGIIEPSILDAVSGLSTETSTVTEAYPWLSDNTLKYKITKVGEGDDKGKPLDNFQCGVCNLGDVSSTTGRNRSFNFTNLYLVPPRTEMNVESTDYCFIKADGTDDRANIGNKKVFFSDNKLDYNLNPDFVNSNINVNDSVITEMAYSTLKSILEL